MVLVRFDLHESTRGKTFSRKGAKGADAKAQSAAAFPKVFFASLRAFAPLREKTFATDPLCIIPT
jgi:hypothetical protein